MRIVSVLLTAFLLVATGTPASAAWREAKTKHFVIYSEQNAADLAAYAERLERFDAAVRRVRRMTDPPLTDGAKVTIYVLPTLGALQRLHGGSDSVLGFYKPRAAGSVAFVTNRLEESRNGLSAAHVFQHEYLHHLMLSDIKTPLAAWMIEGFAEFFATAEIGKDGAIKLGYPPKARAYGVLNDLGFNAEQLLSGIAPRNENERSSLYGKGWVLTHYLTFSKERKGQLEAYVAGLAKGQSGLEAARAAFGDLKQLDKEIDRYARGSLQGVIINPGPKPEVAIRELREGEAAIMGVRIRSERGVNPRTAGPVAEEARTIAARFPADPFVQSTLAETEFDVRNFPAAIAAADRALAADPKNVQAMTYKGRALMAQALASRDPTAWPEVRRWFVRANRADTENAEPLYLYYQSFLAAGEKPPEAAVEGLYYSFALAPQDLGLRFTLVRQLLIEGKTAIAEPLFAAIAFNPHLNTAARPNLALTLERIKARDSKGALAALEADRRQDSGAAQD